MIQMIRLQMMWMIQIVEISQPFLTVTPSQVDSGKKQGGTFTVDVNSSSRGVYPISYNDGNGWISVKIEIVSTVVKL